jgi:hypothetical protein
VDVVVIPNEKAAEYREIVMGNSILISALVMEAVFAAYCMITKSDRQKARGFLRIGALAAFVLLTVVSVIHWSFRWYLLAALLFVWAAPGVWTLARKKAENKEYRAGRTLVRAVAALLLVCIAVTPALIFPQHTLPKMTGKHTVATVQFTYVDTSRAETFAHTGENRKVNVEFWYPQDPGGRYPLIGSPTERLG